MITLYTGLPRSGKSYKMVSDLLDLKEKFFIVQNIEGLNLNLFPHIIDFRDYISTDPELKMEFNEFFSKDYQIKFCAEIREKYDLPVLVIIDECHEWLDRSFKSLKLWLSYHGHLGQTVWLVSHRAANISSVYRSFIEIEYRAKSSSMIFLPGYFIYNRISGGVRLGYTKVKKRKDVFDAYKSQHEEYSKSRKSAMLPLMLAMGVLGFGLFIMLPKYMFGNPAAVKAKIAKSSVLAADVPGIGVLPALIVNKMIVDVAKRDVVEMQYAFAGVMGSQAVLEDRKTGLQVILSRVPYGLLKLDNNGSDSLTTWSSTYRKVITFYNCDRYEVSVSGRSLRTGTETVGAGLVF